MKDMSSGAAQSENEPVAWRYRRSEEWGEQYWHYFTKEPRFRDEEEIWQPLYLHPPALTPAEIEGLQREIEHLTKSGITEVAVRNPSVAEYMKHWEARAAAAESKLAALQEGSGTQPLGYVTKEDLTKLRTGVSCVDLFGSVVPKGAELIPVYVAPPPPSHAMVTDEQREAWMDGDTTGAYVGVEGSKRLPLKAAPVDHVVVIGQHEKAIDAALSAHCRAIEGGYLRTTRHMNEIVSAYLKVIGLQTTPVGHVVLPVDLREITSHPIAAKFHDLAVELEKLPAGDRQTEMAAVLNGLRVDAQNLINGHDFMRISSVRMTLNILDDVRDGVEEPSVIGPALSATEGSKG